MGVTNLTPKEESAVISAQMVETKSDNVGRLSGRQGLVGSISLRFLA